ncbi:MAG: galactonate dehydratase [Candidatus Bathyarchaeia archaeon]
MKITDVRTTVCNAMWSPGRGRNFVFVHVSTDEGITGLGESFGWGIGPAVVEAAVKAYRPLLIGEDPFDLEKLWRRLYFESFFYTSPAAYSGIEIALWDIMGKKLGLPVWKLLGGKCRDRVKVYSHAGGAKPEDLARNASKLVSQGYTAVKFDPFEVDQLSHSSSISDILDAVEKVRAVREAVGRDVEVLIEGHGKFNAHTAIKVGKKLERFDPYFFEEPVPQENVDAMAKVAAHLDLPIATGERVYTRNGFRDYLEKEAADIIQPDLTNTGGISEAKKIAAMAEGYYVPLAPHNPNGPVSTMASVHLAVAIPNFVILEYVANDVPWVGEITAEPIEVKNGHIELPMKPGLGIELNEEEVVKHPATEWPFLAG